MAEQVFADGGSAFHGVEPAFGTFRRARIRIPLRELRRHVGELLARNGHAVGPGEETRTGAKRFDLAVGLGDLAAQLVDLGRKPSARRFRLVTLGLLLRVEIELGDRVAPRAASAGSWLENSICNTRDLAIGKTVSRDRNASTSRSSGLPARPPLSSDKTIAAGLVDSGGLNSTRCANRTD